MASAGNMLNQINNTEIVEKKVDVEQALSRMRKPLEQTSLNIEVYGVYSLPDAWKSKIDDPNEQVYTYELDVCGVTIKNAKVFPRELSEEEKAEIEAAKNVKGKQPPPKDPKKKEEEPSKEEVERIEREKKEKEEKLRKQLEEWEALDEETKFNRTAEDIFKEPCIKFHNIYATKRIEYLNQQLQNQTENEEEVRAQIQELQRKIYVGNAITEKTKYELVEFEEFVSQDKGCWIRFMKLPPPEEEILDPKAAAAKKAPAKGGKGAPSEDLKPTYGRAWLNFEDLLVPGGIETKQRVFLQTCPPLVKKAGDDGVERYVQADEYENVFENNKSYVYLKITLTDPVTSTLPDQPEPLPHEVVPVKQFIKWPFSKDPTEDFKKQITLAIESLAKEYYVMFQNELENEAQGAKADQELGESFEERKKEFLYEINTSGKYHILKEKLKKTIVRIVKEYFKMTGSIKGLNKDERDHFYTTLYAYLVDQMRTTVAQLVERKKNELHENITVPQEQYLKERDYVVEQQTKESLPDRYKRLSSEYENLYCNLNEAEQYMLKYVALFEGDPHKMMEIGIFYLRIGKIEKANDYLRDAYSFQIKNQQMGLMYACYLIQSQRYKEAIVILNKLASEKYEEAKVSILLSIAYEQDSEALLAAKFRTSSFVKILRDQGLISQLGQSHELNKPKSQPPIKIIPGQQQQQVQQEEPTNRFESAPAYGNKRLPVDQQDLIFIELAEFLSEYYLSSLGVKVLTFVTNLDATAPNILKFYQILGKLEIQRKRYEEALTQFRQILDKDKTNLKTLINQGHCLFFLKRWNEAETTYLKAVKISNFSGVKIEDPYLLDRLGTVYLQDERFELASQIFDEVITQPNYSSYALYCDAVSYVALSDKNWNYGTVAENLLKRANIMDPNNPDIWGYITLFKADQVNLSFQSLKQALKLKIQNIELLKKIANSMWKQKQYEAAWQAIEQAYRARASKDSIRHQKKLEEFLKLAKDCTNEAQMRTKFKETLVKSNCLKEDDAIFELHIMNEQTRSWTIAV